MEPITWANPYVRDLAPYEPGKSIETLERELGISSSIKLASNENPFGPSPFVLERLKTKDWKLAQYPDAHGFNLKKAISKHIDIKPECITLGNGSEEIFRYVIQGFVGKDQAILIPQYSFIAYELIAKSLGVTVQKAPVTNWKVDVESLLSSVQPQTKAIFIANPNNPTGTYITMAELERLLQQIPENILIVMDEAYFEYMDNQDYPKSLLLLQNFPNLIITRTFSKAYGLAGLRVGFSISHESIANIFNRIRAPFNTNKIALEAATWALQDQAFMHDGLEVIRQNKKMLNTYFERKKVKVISTSGNFLTIELLNAQAVYQFLLQHGVIVRPLNPYGLPQHLRITIGTQPQMERFIETFDKI